MITTMYNTEMYHSAKGSHWQKKNHKYLRIENGRYIYPDGSSASGTNTYTTSTYSTNRNGVAGRTDRVYKVNKNRLFDRRTSYNVNANSIGANKSTKSYADKNVTVKVTEYGRLHMKRLAATAKVSEITSNVSSKAHSTAVKGYSSAKKLASKVSSVKASSILGSNKTKRNNKTGKEYEYNHHLTTSYHRNKTGKEYEYNHHLTTSYHRNKKSR